MIRKAFLGLAVLVVFGLTLALALSDPGRAALAILAWVALAYVLVRAAPGIARDFVALGRYRPGLRRRRASDGRGQF